MFVGAVVIHDHVQADPGVCLGDLFHEVQELFVAVPVVAAVGDLAGGDLEGGKQGGGAVAGVVVGGLLR